MENTLREIGAYRVQDPSFDIQQLDSCQLLIKFGATGTTIAVFEKESSQFLFLENFHYNHAESDTSLVVRLQNIWNSHEFLSASFWKEVVLIPVNTHFSVVPSKFFSEELSSRYLQLNSRISTVREKVFTHQIESIESTAIFAFGVEVYDWFREVYPQAEIKCTHVASSFLLGITQSTSSSLLHTIYVNTSGDLLVITVIQDGEVKFVNTFNYHRSSEDFNYYVLLVINELNLPQQLVEVKVWGDIDENLGQLNVLKSYVKYSSFGERSDRFIFTVPFNDIPNHFNLDIFSATSL